MRQGRRGTLAHTYVWATDEGIEGLLERLDRVRRLDIFIERRYLDRDFATVVPFQTLQAHWSHASLYVGNGFATVVPFQTLQAPPFLSLVPIPPTDWLVVGPYPTASCPSCPCPNVVSA